MYDKLKIASEQFHFFDNYEQFQLCSYWELVIVAYVFKRILYDCILRGNIVDISLIEWKFPPRHCSNMKPSLRFIGFSKAGKLMKMLAFR